MRARDLHLAGRAVHNLPPTPAIDTATGKSEVAREDLLGALRQVAFAASREPTRFYLNGIFIVDEGGSLGLIGTDGYRLARSCISSAPFTQDRRCIVPISTVTVLVKLLTKSKANQVKLRRSKSLFELTTPEFTVTTKLIDGSFPDYRRVIPPVPDSGVTVARADMVEALARLGAVVESKKKGRPLVGLTWDPTDPVLRLSLPLNLVRLTTPFRRPSQAAPWSPRRRFHTSSSWSTKRAARTSTSPAMAAATPSCFPIPETPRCCSCKCLARCRGNRREPHRRCPGSQNPTEQKTHRGKGESNMQNALMKQPLIADDGWGDAAAEAGERTIRGRP